MGASLKGVRDRVSLLTKVRTHGRGEAFGLSNPPACVSKTLPPCSCGGTAPPRRSSRRGKWPSASSRSTPRVAFFFWKAAGRLAASIRYIKSADRDRGNWPRCSCSKHLTTVGRSTLCHFQSSMSHRNRAEPSHKPSRCKLITRVWFWNGMCTFRFNSRCIRF